MDTHRRALNVVDVAVVVQSKLATKMVPSCKHLRICHIHAKGANKNACKQSELTFIQENGLHSTLLTEYLQLLTTRYHCRDFCPT
mmetsp:Transcript_6996/g.10631  ORF Transcript_6996/g.10631 Transcript_6996/m.10631 type:complete len:85 (-) Transcript_6996:1367-1621(-)